ncbi:uncharacterized protein LACBIDRAFT_331051 [Laccaria bicolor S238N-H82]|uniref:Predicted protein n=1 Tax=Laccaria bicolor (strain S238N-H82 / ATCC MYA-4686) TaxID=486041 RepID=B0DNA2_LACBS|nr:uncharacterized protein LACBIDRAFT_331051 [Laccaria bicolor S238N-H82]EDR03834.1 predicted protein [Laccaria bicolor S238N-H82]|eukprot:XP_001885402.1 predicted protein [Laccaria bicolor S238N-H82]
MTVDMPDFNTNNLKATHGGRLGLWRPPSVGATPIDWASSCLLPSLGGDTGHGCCESQRRRFSIYYLFHFVNCFSRVRSCLMLVLKYTSSAIPMASQWIRFQLSCTGAHNMLTSSYMYILGSEFLPFDSEELDIDEVADGFRVSKSLSSSLSLIIMIQEYRDNYKKKLVVKCKLPHSNVTRDLLSTNEARLEIARDVLCSLSEALPMPRLPPSDIRRGSNILRFKTHLAREHGAVLNISASISLFASFWTPLGLAGSINRYNDAAKMLPPTTVTESNDLPTLVAPAYLARVEARIMPFSEQICLVQQGHGISEKAEGGSWSTADAGSSQAFVKSGGLLSSMASCIDVSDSAEG